MLMDEAEEIAKNLKPPRCPKCGAEIDHLHFYAYELVKADFWVVDGRSEYSGWDSLGDMLDEVEYSCPECGEVLFKHEDDAIKFLRGEL
jgi:predicted RNA-binding Zn-ribbon protein involved in translation (DUF1610 family)